MVEKEGDWMGTGGGKTRFSCERKNKTTVSWSELFYSM